MAVSPLEPLPADQRAVVALVLKEGRSYDEIAELLGMRVEAVRARARAGLAGLAGDNGLPGEVTGPLADYLLGQQPPADADATRGLLAESGPARAWAADVAGSLADVAPHGLPEIPGPAEAAAEAPPEAPADAPSGAAVEAQRGTRAEPPPEAGADAPREAAAEAPHEAAAPASPPGPRPRPLREPAAAAGGDAPPASSRIGGAILIAGVIAVIAVVLFLVLSGGDDPADEQVASAPTPTATATPAPGADAQVADSIPLRSTTGGKATGTMTVLLEGRQLLFTLEAQGVPPSRAGAAYAVWFTGPRGRARRLGFTNPVGQDGRLGIQGPGNDDLDAFPRLYATYERVVVSQETDEDAKRPTKVILSGRLPRGRD